MNKVEYTDDELRHFESEVATAIQHGCNPDEAL